MLKMVPYIFRKLTLLLLVFFLIPVRAGKPESSERLIHLAELHARMEVQNGRTEMQTKVSRESVTTNYFDFYNRMRLL